MILYSSLEDIRGLLVISSVAEPGRFWPAPAQAPIKSKLSTIKHLFWSTVLDFFNKHLINTGTNRENIIQNFFGLFKVEPEPRAGPSHRLRLRPKSTGSDRLRLRNTGYRYRYRIRWYKNILLRIILVRTVAVQHFRNFWNPLNLWDSWLYYYHVTSRPNLRIFLLRNIFIKKIFKINFT